MAVDRSLGATLMKILAFCLPSLQSCLDSEELSCNGLLYDKALPFTAAVLSEKARLYGNFCLVISRSK